MQWFHLLEQHPPLLLLVTALFALAVGSFLNVVIHRLPRMIEEDWRRECDQGTEAADKARKLAGAGKLKEALGELQDGLSTSAQRRDRFLWRLRMAQLCYDAQRLQLAAPLLEECFEEIKRYHIDEWEPTLAVDVARTLYRCRKSLTSSEKSPAHEALESVRESFAWLCQLDPLAALAAEPSGMHKEGITSACTMSFARVRCCTYSSMSPCHPNESLQRHAKTPIRISGDSSGSGGEKESP